MNSKIPRISQLTRILVAVMLANTSLAVLTVLSNSLERSTEFGLEMFIEECNQIRDVYYPECRENSMRGSELTVYVSCLYRKTVFQIVLRITDSVLRILVENSMVVCCLFQLLKI